MAKRGSDVARELARTEPARWLTAMSASPLTGAAVAGAFPVPEAAEPVLLALVAGVIARPPG
jgi:hypothetical protein